MRLIPIRRWGAHFDPLGLVSPSGPTGQITMQIWDLIVVGGGVAGSALAYAQAKVSLHPTVA